jgi:glycosyltransferase involved in cell wall biosynthesis
MIKISICIPVHNREHLIVRAIKSAQNQIYKNIEIVVVDNYSNDNTYSTIKEFSNSDPRIKCYQNSTNIGALKNFEKAIEYSTGDYVVLLGSDDWLDEDFISNKVEVISRYPNISFVSGMVKIFNQDKSNNINLYSLYNYRRHSMSREYLNNNFYKRFLISYFCLFRRDLIINNFRHTYEDEYNWGVYDKGLGLDLINCLDIVNKTTNFDSYYAPGGAYCFCNQEQRESNDIINSYKAKNEIIKTIRDYKYNIYLLSKHLALFDVHAANKFVRFKNNLLIYELIKRFFCKETYSKLTWIELKDYKKQIKIDAKVFVIEIILLPLTIMNKILNKLLRFLKLKIYKLIYRL